jgi:hypothetical protein
VIIDGQPRLATLWVLLIVLRDQACQAENDLTNVLPQRRTSTVQHSPTPSQQEQFYQPDGFHYLNVIKALPDDRYFRY